MTKVNENFLKMPGSYLFAEVARRIAAYSAAHPQARIIKLSIGDVTRPLVPAVVEAMKKAVAEQGTADAHPATARSRATSSSARPLPTATTRPAA